MITSRVKINSSLINVMAQAALKASKGLVRDFSEVEHLQVSQKGPANFVSAADHRSEKNIIESLRKARPDFSMLLEEAGAFEGDDPKHRWIVDPLDGTTNFLHSQPHFAVSIALEFDHEIIAGVTYDPIKDELFYAEKGKGAYMNDRRLRVSSRRDLSLALVGLTRMSHSMVDLDAFGKAALRLKNQVAGFRVSGSACLDLAYLAAGRYDIVLGNSLSPWDIAAGLVMIREAGGHVSEFEGGPAHLEPQPVWASNAFLKEKTHDLLFV